MTKYFIIALLVFSSCQSQENNTPAIKPRVERVVISDTNFFSYLSTLTLPSKLSFCGEEVPLDEPEVRERAEREFYMLLQQPGQLVLYIKRAGKYFDMYDRVIKENNLPPDLKYVSVAESALYMARSSKGAVGLWQFMEGTARAMGLTVNEYVDERRNPEKSTYAAMKYLQSGYRNTGSWTLAAAGYNMGHGGLAENIDYQLVKSFYDLYLNEETSRYILRIVIIKELMENCAKYGFNVSNDDKYSPDSTKMISVPYPVENLAEWAISNNTTYKDVKILNPWILKRSLPAPPSGKPWQIAIPQ